MGSCGSCQQKSVRLHPPAPLFQIKRGYRARWNEIDFSVESESDQWTLRVENTISKETLYLAHRGGSHAAQSAAADFASFRLACGSQSSPAQMAKELTWQAYW
jgi:hypothetical protein